MTMILTDRAELSEGAIPTTIRNAVTFVAEAFTVWQARRARRAALVHLLELETCRLDDLGLSVETVRDALVNTR